MISQSKYRSCNISMSVREVLKQVIAWKSSEIMGYKGF